MGTDFFPSLSSRQPQTENIPSSTQPSNVAVAHNHSATPSTTHVMESDQLDTLHQSSLIGESIEDQLQAWLKEAQRRQEIERSQESASASQRVKHYQNLEIPTRKPVNGQNLTNRPIQENTPNVLVERNAPNASVPFLLQQTGQTFPPAPQRPLIPPPPLPQSQSHPNRELPGFIDEDRILRKQQVPGDGRCVECATDTILNEFCIPPTKPEEWKPKRSDQWRDVGEIIDLARKKGLKVKRYDVENFVANRITGIENTKAFIIGEPGHVVALVQRKDFHESDSYDQVKSQSKRYSGDTAQDALLDYEKQNNVISDVVLTFRERVPAHSPEFNAKDSYNEGVALGRSGDWKEAMDEFDEVITCLRGTEEPKQRVLLANAFYSKGVAHYKLHRWKEAVEAFNEVIRRFGETADPALHPELDKIVVKALRAKDVAQHKRLVHGDGEQTGA